MRSSTKKIFKHGGSYAVHLPMSFVKNFPELREVVIDELPNRVSIRPKTNLDTIESEPLFGKFIHALASDALRNPKKLHEARKVWDTEWDDLLKGVNPDEE